MPKFSAYMKGNDGSVGPPGSSIINGIVSTTNDLPRGGGNKIAYLVGVSNPKKLYVWNASTGEWEDQGTTANKLGAVTASITTTPTGYPSVKVTHSTSNQEDKINFSFTIPDVNDAKVNRTGDTMTGSLNIASGAPLNLLRDGDKVIGFKAADGTKQADLFVTESNHHFGFRSFNQHLHPDVFLLPIVDAGITTTTSISYDILTSKNTITIAQGGTGITTNPSMLINLESTSAASIFTSTPRPGVTGTLPVARGGTGLGTHIANAVLVGNGTNAIKNIASKSGAFYATAANGTPVFGTLPIEQGGTGATTTANALANLGAVSKSGDTMTGHLFIRQDTNTISNTTQMSFAIGRAGKTYIVNNGYSGGATFTAIIQEGSTGAYEQFTLPITLSTDSGTYNILTSKNTITIAQGGTGATTAADALANLGAVNKAGDTMSDTLSIKKSIYDASASSISTATDSLFAVKDKNNRYICYTRGRQETDGATSIDIRARRFNSGNIDNFLMLKVAADGTRSVSVSDSTIWRNALGASAGIWSIAQGGTGTSTVVNARKAFFGSNLNTTAKHLIAITDSYANGGYVSLPLSTNLGGTGGTDSGWMSITPKAENVAFGKIIYRKVGAFVEIVGYGIKLANNLTGRSINLASLPSAIRTNLATTEEDIRILLCGSILRPENTINTYDPINVEIYNNYGLNLIRPSWITTIETTYTINFHGVYFVE